MGMGGLAGSVMPSTGWLADVVPSASAYNAMQCNTIQVLPELEDANVNARPVIKADCIKFVTTFRQVPSLYLPLLYLSYPTLSCSLPPRLSGTRPPSRAMPQPDRQTVIATNTDKQAAISRGHAPAAHAPAHQPPDGHPGGGPDIHGPLRRAPPQRQGSVRLVLFVCLVCLVLSCLFGEASLRVVWRGGTKRCAANARCPDRPNDPSVSSIYREFAAVGAVDAATGAGRSAAVPQRAV